LRDAFVFTRKDFFVNNTSNKNSTGSVKKGSGTWIASSAWPIIDCPQVASPYWAYSADVECAVKENNNMQNKKEIRFSM